MPETTGAAWAHTTARIFECAALAVICVVEPAVPLIFAGMIVSLAAIAAVYLYATGDSEASDEPGRTRKSRG